jgi:hypothetical protein
LFSFKGDKKDEGLGDFISKKIKEFFEAMKLWIAETIPGGNKLLEMLGLGKVSERTLQEKKLADLEEEARTGTSLTADLNQMRSIVQGKRKKLLHSKNN